MATTRLASSMKQALLQIINDAIDAGGAGSVLKFYTGSMPAGPDTAITTQTLLGTVTLPYPCASAPGSLTSTALTIGTITQDSEADASGVATWARIFARTSGDVLTAKVDVDVSNLGGTGVLQMNTVNFAAGGPILVKSLVFVVL